jgi:NAD+ synthase
VQRRARPSLEAYLGIVAASNMKQRTRNQLEYFHADPLNDAVTETSNCLDSDQGFFVKNGEGAADLKPIAHLYKSQVYQLAEFLGVPEEIRLRPPSTDAYSLGQTQEEFYFSTLHNQMGLCLFAATNKIPPDEAARAFSLTADQVERVYRDIQSKRRATAYPHSPPLLVEDVLEVSA